MTDAMDVAHAGKEEHLSHKSDGEPYSSFCSYCQVYYHAVEIDGTTHLAREYGITQFKALCEEDLIVEEDVATRKGEISEENIDCEKCKEMIQ